MSSRMPSAQRPASEHSTHYYPAVMKKVSSANTTIFLSQNTNGRNNATNHLKGEEIYSKSRELDGHQNGEFSNESKDVGDNQWKSIRVVRNSSSFTHSSNHLHAPASILRTSSNSSSLNSSHDDEKVFNINRDIVMNTDNHEEFTYGKGFVNKLRQRFQTADVEKPAMVPVLHFSAKRAQSCENISKKTKLKDTIHTSEDKTDCKHIVHSVENLVTGSNAEHNKTAIVIPLHDSGSEVSSKHPPEEEDSNLIPQNVVASTKVLFEKIASNAAPNQHSKPILRKTNVPAPKSGLTSQPKSVSDTHVQNGVLNSSVANHSKVSPTFSNNVPTRSQSQTFSHNSNVDLSILRPKRDQNSTVAKDSLDSEKTGNFKSNLLGVSSSLIDLRIVDQSLDRRSSPADRNSLNLDFSLPKKAVAADTASSKPSPVVPASSDNFVPKRTKAITPAPPGKLVIRPASNLMPAATSAESLKLTKFNDIKTGEFEAAASTKWDNDIPVSSVDDMCDDDDDVAATGAGSASPGVSREGENSGSLFRSSYNFEGAGVVLAKSSLGKSKKSKGLKLQFNDAATFTHEYPSEQTMLDQMSPEQVDSPRDDNQVRRGSLSDEEEDSRTGKKMLSAPALTASSGGGSGGLAAYKSKLQLDYQMGAASGRSGSSVGGRSGPQPSSTSPASSSSSSLSHDTRVTSASRSSDPWSGSSSSSSDLLF